VFDIRRFAKFYRIPLTKLTRKALICDKISSSFNNYQIPHEITSSRVLETKTELPSNTINIRNVLPIMSQISPMISDYLVIKLNKNEFMDSSKSLMYVLLFQQMTEFNEPDEVFRDEDEYTQDPINPNILYHIIRSNSTDITRFINNIRAIVDPENFYQFSVDNLISKQDYENIIPKPVKIDFDQAKEILSSWQINTDDIDSDLYNESRSKSFNRSLIPEPRSNDFRLEPLRTRYRESMPVLSPINTPDITINPPDGSISISIDMKKFNNGGYKYLLNLIDNESIYHTTGYADDEDINYVILNIIANSSKAKFTLLDAIAKENVPIVDLTNISRKRYLVPIEHFQ
jgi:hypothetical protein